MKDGRKRVWVIEGRNSNDTFFRRTIPHGLLTAPEVEALLQRLASRHLTAAEVLGASMRTRAKSYTALLKVSRETGPNRFNLWTELDPHYTARAEDDRGLPDVDEDEAEPSTAGGDPQAHA